MRGVRQGITPPALLVFTDSWGGRTLEGSAEGRMVFLD
jgi:hypothetical protein